MGMEIERKFTIKKMPGNPEDYDCHRIIQAYLCKNPVVRIRKSDNDYYLTYKGQGMMAREEYNLPLDKDSFDHLLKKADGNVISKTRYLIPIKNGLTVELDVFDPPLAPLVIAEVEFPDRETADAYIPEDWFAEDVTEDPAYHNVNMVYKERL